MNSDYRRKRLHFQENRVWCPCHNLVQPSLSDYPVHVALRLHSDFTFGRLFQGFQYGFVVYHGMDPNLMPQSFTSRRQAFCCRRMVATADTHPRIMLGRTRVECDLIIRDRQVINGKHAKPSNFSHLRDVPIATVHSNVCTINEPITSTRMREPYLLGS